MSRPAPGEPLTNPFRCYLMGQESLLIHCAEALLTRGHAVLGVIVSEPRLVSWAHERGVAVIDPRSDLVARLSAEPFDYFFSVTNFAIVPDALLALARLGGINFHDGPLPRYAGLNVPAWALSRGEVEHAVSWHAMEGGVDEGDVLKERAFALAARETSFTLNTKCYEAGIDSFAELADELGAGTVQRRKQDLSQRSYFGKYARPAALALLDWTRPARELDALVRALDFGPHDNPLAVAKVLLGSEVYVVREAAPHDAPETATQPGVLLRAAETLRVATREGQLEISKLATLDGRDVDIPSLVTRLALKEGAELERLDAATVERLTGQGAQLARHEAFWSKRLAALAPVELPASDSPGEGAQSVVTRSMSIAPAARGGESPADSVVAALCGFLARVSEQARFDVGFVDDALTRTVRGAERFFARHAFLHVDVPSEVTFSTHRDAVFEELANVRKRVTFGLDLAARRRAVQGAGKPLRVLIELRGEGKTTLLDAFTPEEHGSLQLGLSVSADGSELQWMANSRSLDEPALASLCDRFAAFLAGIAQNPELPLARIPLLSEAERQRVIVTWNDTARPFDVELCVHQAFAAQAVRTPDAVAVVFEGTELTYRELDSRTNRLAHHLQSLGVGPDVRVGVAVERSLELVVSILGIQKAGGAYVPMDPTYPAERIAFMIEDARVAVLISQLGLLPDGLLRAAPSGGTKTVHIDTDWDAIAAQPDTRPPGAVLPHHLAYVIYTSGSTGKPKGVMVEHRNVINFFVGMDERIPHDQQPKVWLAVTSLSFDISVLELFWTLARGFTVVLYRDRTAEVANRPRARSGPHRDLSFSLFYFASDEGEAVADKYRLLLEGARFADKNGFVAVWTPERHFHAFGGLYPNPSIAAAALAMITEKVHLRAGSCVLPLHNPLRIVEEWSLVDNLSNGRVGISFASGWQPNDFVLAPENFADRKEIMFRGIDTVRRLWRGESIRMKSPTGKEIDIRTLPRPVQKELPIWVTAAGNPETFQQAGTIGANVLTHLLGQTFEEVAEKCALYRKSWQEAGHAGRGTITMMLHTFVGTDEDEVRETVRGPMKGYLRSAVNLIKQAAWSFPTFKQRADATGTTPAAIFDKQDLSEDDMSALLDHAFERYFRTSGLFGTPASCAEIVDKLREADVDEVGCLMDYGVPTATVMEHMPLLAEVKRLANQPVAAASHSEHSLAAQLARHQVTHLQCTPSMLGMILGDPASRTALAGLACIMIGGEAFPLALAKELRRATRARILNMYGPTETTIWSSTDVVEPEEGSITIGRPIANTQLYVLDQHLEPVPPGAAGELMIGGAGVVRGYLHRPELTAERFIRDPFQSDPAARLYRTGDLVRWGRDGRVVFMGRLDHQVKIRGHRIELGEIEAVLLEEAGVREAVVIAREDAPGDKRLVAYLTARPGEAIASAELRSRLRARLPEYMVPAQIVVLSALPLTPNAKIDRKALPLPDSVRALPEAAYIAPATELETTIATVWAELLHVQKVGLEDNFFDLGGHSLLTVQAHRKLRELTGRDIALTDLFRFPTIRGLVGYLESPDAQGGDLGKSLSRAEARKESLNRRQELRQRRKPQSESGE